MGASLGEQTERLKKHIEAEKEKAVQAAEEQAAEAEAALLEAKKKKKKSKKNKKSKEEKSKEDGEGNAALAETMESGVYSKQEITDAPDGSNVGKLFNLSEFASIFER